MRTRKNIVISIMAMIGMILIILDSQTAIRGVSAGIDLCIKSIIPALFPFCILSRQITASAIDLRIPFLRTLGILCGIPPGTESIFILSFVGGYPFGAQCVNDAYKNKILSYQDAKRMTAFCSNAGPAFIFGILGSVFDNIAIPWILLVVQVISSVLVGMILPHPRDKKCNTETIPATKASAVIEDSIKTMAVICGWVILFRLMICYCDKWIFGMQTEIRSVIIGILELSNGCISLGELSLPGLRYIVASGMLSFGGLCVAMQTRSVTNDIGKTLYIPGKILQACISVIFSCSTQFLLFPQNQQFRAPIPLSLTCFTIISTVVLVLYRKRGGNSSEHSV